MEKLQEAQRVFDKLSKDNITTISKEMKTLVGNHDISTIFFDSLFGLNSSNVEKSDIWELWIQCIPIFNQNTNDQFKKDIVHDSIQKFNSLIKGPDYKIHNQIMCSWFSCLLVDKFIKADQYSQIFRSIIKSNNFELTEKVSIIYSSLKISGETIDNKEHPLTECLFLFTYLKMQMEKCSLLLKTKIKDLFELRNFGWNLEEYESSIRNEGAIAKKEIQDYINEKKKIYDNLISFLFVFQSLSPATHSSKRFIKLYNIIKKKSNKPSQILKYSTYLKITKKFFFFFSKKK